MLGSLAAAWAAEIRGLGGDMRVPGASGGNGVDGREPQAMATSGTIPGRWLVSDGVYRSFGGADGLFGCGFLVKTGCGFDQRKPVSLQHSLVYVLRGTGVYIDADDRRWDLEPGSFFHRFTDPRNRSCPLAFLTEAFVWRHVTRHPSSVVASPVG